MKNKLIAEAEIKVNAPVEAVWDALVNPEKIKQYFFGTNVETDWKTGSMIFWKGVWEGKPYEDRGKILKVENNRILSYSHFSPLSGNPDIPENYHTVTVRLSTDGKMTKISLSQDNNETENEKEQSQKNWNMMLESLKKMLEE